jgi:hypothetical protein
VPDIVKTHFGEKRLFMGAAAHCQDGIRYMEATGVDNPSVNSLRVALGWAKFPVG